MPSAVEEERWAEVNQCSPRPAEQIPPFTLGSIEAHKTAASPDLLTYLVPDKGPLAGPMQRTIFWPEEGHLMAPALCRSH